MTKRCSLCKEEKLLTSFHINRAEKSGRVSRCKDCIKNRILSDEAKENKKIYNRARSRRYHSGFLPEEFQEKLKIQNNKCAICKIDSKTSVVWHADHDHDTGQKRGILCQKCNMGIGLLGEDIEILEQAIMYIKKYQNEMNEVASSPDTTRRLA